MSRSGALLGGGILLLLVLAVMAAPDIDIVTSSPLPDAEFGELYSVQLEAEAGANCPEECTWELVPWSPDPSPYSVSASGLVSGTAENPGLCGQTVKFVVEVATDTNPVKTGTKLFSFSVNCTNGPPIVDAGPDQLICGNVASLGGTYDDDGLPGNPVTVAWSKESGPGSVSFSDGTALDTSATFTTFGVYTLKLTVGDGDLTGSDTLKVTHNEVPSVNAGADRTLTLPNANVAVSGTVSDDGLPSALSLEWSATGPGAVNFANKSSAMTSATFSAQGEYTLTLSASDGSSCGPVSDTLQVTVLPPEPEPPGQPVVDAGVDQVVCTGAVNLSGSYVADGPVTVAWNKLGGPGNVSFNNANLLNTSATFTAFGIYTLELTVDDGDLFGSDTLQVTYNQAPTVNAGVDQTVALPGATVMLSGSANDEDGLPSPLSRQWSATGPGVVNFSDSTSETATAEFSVPGEYTLTLSASDGSPCGSVSDTLTITVLPANKAPVVEAGPGQMITLGEPALLKGDVSDDGLPIGGSLTTKWTASGLGDAKFWDDESPLTTVEFSDVGTYTLTLVASDSELTGEDSLEVEVKQPGPQSCVAFASADASELLRTETLSLRAVFEEVQPSVGDVHIEWGFTGSGMAEITPSPVDVAVAGRENFTVEAAATFSESGLYFLSMNVTAPGCNVVDYLPVRVYDPLEITTEELPTAWLGRPYSKVLSATGGKSPLEWDLTAEREGCNLGPWTGPDIQFRAIEDDCVLRPVPVSVTVVDALGQQIPAEYSLEVRRLHLIANPDPLPRIEAESSQSGGINSARLEFDPDSLPADSQGMPQKCTLVAGSLPEGVRLNDACQFSLDETGPSTGAAKITVVRPRAAAEEAEVLGCTPGEIVPGQPRECRFAVKAEDDKGAANCVAAKYCDVFAIETVRPPPPAEACEAEGRLPDAIVGADYSVEIEGLTSIPFGELPPGIYFDRESTMLNGSPSSAQALYAKISNTPATAPEWAYRFEAMTDSGLVQHCLPVLEKLEILPTDKEVISHVNVPLAAPLLGQGGRPPYVWSVPEVEQDEELCGPGGTPLVVPGLCLTKDGQIAGSPREVGEYPISVELTYEGQDPLKASGEVLVEVIPPLGITTPAQLPEATVDVEYVQELVEANAYGSSCWNVGSDPCDAPGSVTTAAANGDECAGLPPNFELGTNGVLRGQPQAAQAGKTFCFVATVTDELDGVAQGLFRLNVRPPQPPPLVLEVPAGGEVSPLPSVLAPADSQRIRLSLALAPGEEYAYPLTGELVIEFAHNADAAPQGTDPDPQWLFDGVLSGRAVPFRIEAGCHIATFTNAPQSGDDRCAVLAPEVRAGTVAGMVTYRVTELEALGTSFQDETLGTQTIERLPPVVTSVVPGTESSSSFSLLVAGYSTKRRLTSFRYVFQAKRGRTLDGTTQIVNANYAPFFDATSGMFQFKQPFTVFDGDISFIESVEVVAIDGDGVSSSVFRKVF